MTVTCRLPFIFKCDRCGVILDTHEYGISDSNYKLYSEEWQLQKRNGNYIHYCNICKEE